MDLKTKYTVKGLGKETTISSVVNIFTTADGSKIEKVEDKWNGKLPDSSIADVSNVFQLCKFLLVGELLCWLGVPAWIFGLYTKG